MARRHARAGTPAAAPRCRRRRTLLATGAALAAAAASAALRAQGFPARPIRIVVPFGAGGIGDLCARAVGQALAQELGGQVVVENRPGAGGVVASGLVAKAQPDGHTLLLVSNATAVSGALFRSLPYDPLRDFAPISTLGAFGLGIVVPPESRFRDAAELVRFARARPDELTVGTINIGSTQHLAAELFASSADLRLRIVPFNGTPALLAALLGGHVDAAFEILGPALLQTGPRAPRVLAVTTQRRSALLPAVPTLAETVLPGYQVASWNGLAAPARTPPEIVARLNRAVRGALATPATQARLRDLGVEPRAGAPEDLGRLLASETRRWAEVIERARIERQ